MLSDRPYMRGDYQKEKTSFLTWMLSAVIAGFVVQLVFPARFSSDGFDDMAALSGAALKQGHVWTLLTYPFLHRNPLHLLAVVLAIFFVGRELVPEVGERRLRWLTVLATVVGGLLWAGFHFGREGNLMGATTVLWSYLTVFACLFPNRELSFLVFFVLPVTVRPKYILLGMLGADLVGFAFRELPIGKYADDGSLPYSAHLGAMFVGWIYYRYFHDSRWLALRPKTELELPRWLNRAKKNAAGATPDPGAVAAGSAKRDDIRAEIDRILDKINSHGFGALTPQEKQLLDAARDLLSRR